MKKHKIIAVKKNSIAYELGIRKNDILLSVNKEEVKDVLDYKFLTTDENLSIEIQKSDDAKRHYNIQKDYDDDIRLVFENDLMDDIKKCKNKCIFCFIDQMPENMRNSLYVKDDDYRLSFLEGNFVTLTNLDEEDIQRIIDMHLSPLYVSVHALDPKVRCTIMKNPNAAKIYDILKQLTDNGITVNCQIVLVRNVNDGDVLDDTLKGLSDLYPGVNSVAIVPAGITKYRKRLFEILPWDKGSSTNVVNSVNRYQNDMREKNGTSFVYASDEFYVMAQMAVPDAEFYEDFAQMENGVGLISKFQDEFMHSVVKYSKKKPENPHISIATGESAYEFIKKLSDILANKFSMTIDVFRIKNNYFGQSITVAGLITGGDLIAQLKGNIKTKKLLIPEVMLREGEDTFLDDVKVSDVEKELAIKIIVTKINGEDLIKKVLGV